ncbi:MAG TPA: spermidine/putrescine ABC transporter substrate-binding protein [Acidimicrobiales bacterium]|nr:spermidine/putrescine ABC transporter substrate-binding protein [Acidimicrobiales bacterium]
MGVNEEGSIVNAGIDPSFFRGLVQQRLTRRQVLTAAGAGIAAFATRDLSSSAGAATTAKVGSKKWWTEQKLHHKVDFANWPLYIDAFNGKHLSLNHFTATTGIAVNYQEVIQDNASFYATIRPSLQAGQATGYDIMVMTNNNPELGYLIESNWLIPLDHAKMTNFNKYASPLLKSPTFDPGNKYTMAWQSGWTSVAYNSKHVKDPGNSVQILFDKKYAGKVGMLSDPFELGSLGLLALGIEPATSTEKDWSKAATKLKKQKSDGIVLGYYDQSYLQHLKNGDTIISQCYSGDIFQANLNSKYKDLVLMIPKEGMLVWTDNMIIPLHAANPLDAMTCMDYFYSPVTESVVEYYIDYICPVPDAKQQLLHPTGWNKAALKTMYREIQLPTSVTADSLDVFPSPARIKASHPYYPFKNQEEITAWTNLFLPIIQGA